MNYCSIEDAWGSGCNSISNQINDYINEKKPAPKKEEINIDYESKKSKNKKIIKFYHDHNEFN
jgi:hypothetical protein